MQIFEVKADKLIFLKYKYIGLSSYDMQPVNNFQMKKLQILSHFSGVLLQAGETQSALAGELATYETELDESILAPLQKIGEVCKILL